MDDALSTPLEAASDPAPRPDRSARAAPVLPAILASAAWVGVALVGVRIAWDNGEAKGVGLLFQLAAASPLAYWALLLWRGDPIRWSSRDSFALIAAAAVLRGVLLTAEPAQSDDVYRYLWEGRVQRAGENPFRFSPDADALADLRDDNWTLINHPEYTAIYPPLAQASFLLVAAISPCVTAVKVFFTFCDLLTLVVLLRWLARLGRSPAWAALWAFHPLVIAEFSGNGHLDSLMVLLIVTSLWCLDEGWDRRAVLALTGAIAAKLIPLLLLPYFFWKLRRRAWIVLPALLVLLSYLPYAGAGRGLVASLWIYQRDWLYNSPIFDYIRDTIFTTNGWHARYGFYAGLALVGAALWLLKAGPAAAALPVLGFYQAAGPVVHPWYLCLFIALACIRVGGWPWLWLTSAVPLVYWGEPLPWVRALVWGPFLAGLFVQGAFIMANSRKASRASQGSQSGDARHD